MNISTNNLTVQQNLIFSSKIYTVNPTGPIGPRGMTGQKIDTGYTGASITGLTGSTGPIGYVGNGVTGPTGYTGERGISITGPTGPTGSIGKSITGSTGPTGPTGGSLTGYTGASLTVYSSYQYTGQTGINSLNNSIASITLGTGKWLVSWTINNTIDNTNLMTMFYGSITSTTDLYGRYQPLDDSGNAISNWYVYIPNDDITNTNYPIIGADPTGSNTDLSVNTVYTNGLSVDNFNCVPSHTHSLDETITLSTTSYCNVSLDDDVATQYIALTGQNKGTQTHTHSLTKTTFGTSNPFTVNMNSIESSGSSTELSRTSIWYIYYSNV